MTGGATTMPAARAAGRGRSLALALMRMRTLIALIVVFGYFSLTTPNFLALPTLVIVAKHVAILITETAHDEVVGTPYYLSPEQAMGQPVDQRCDLYSLGVVFYELLTGAKPYRASNVEELLNLHVNGPVPLLKPPHDHLQPVLDRLMAKDREQRYPSAQAFLDDLASLEP